jgi:hypothetical protein
MPKKYTLEAWNVLQPTDTAWPNAVRRVSASSTLNLQSLTVVDHKIKLTFSFLEIIDQADSNNILYLNATNQLQLTHSASRKGTLLNKISAALSLSGVAYSKLHYRRITSQLQLNHVATLTGQPHVVEANNNLAGGWEELDPDDVLGVNPWDPEAVAALLNGVGLRHSLSVKKRISLRVKNYLSFSQSALQGPSASATNHLHLGQNIRVVEYEKVTSYLRFQQAALCYTVEAAENTLNLTQELVVDGEIPRTASNILNLKSVVSYITINFCDYSPGIGEGNFTYVPPSIIAPTLTRRETTVLTWPYQSPILTVTLRNPEFDNVEQFEFRRINRRTRGGTLDLYRDESWPKVKRLIMSFTYLNEEQRVSLFNFLIRSLGTEIGLLDFESRQWRGILLTPTSAISQPKRFGHNFSLEFEGELV